MWGNISTCVRNALKQNFNMWASCIEAKFQHVGVMSPRSYDRNRGAVFYNCALCCCVRQNFNMYAPCLDSWSLPRLLFTWNQFIRTRKCIYIPMVGHSSSCGNLHENEPGLIPWILQGGSHRDYSPLVGGPGRSSLRIKLELCQIFILVWAIFI